MQKKIVKNLMAIFSERYYCYNKNNLKYNFQSKRAILKYFYLVTLSVLAMRQLYPTNIEI